MAKSLLFVVTLLLAVLATVVVAQMKTYNGYHLIRLRFNKQADIAELQNALGHEIDVWTHDGALTDKSYNDLFVTKDDARVVMDQCVKSGLKCEVLSQNYQQVLAEAQQSMLAARSSPSNDYFDSYHSYEETIQYITELNKAYPKQTELFTLGQSHEGRNLTGIIFKFAGNSTAPRKAAWFDSGIHAREWISIPVTTFAMTQMAQNYQKDGRITKILDNIDVYWLPVVNPDGYTYTWTKDRMWRKNRRNNGGSNCPGVDLNRNFKPGWGTGASKSTCSETYMGPNPVSEPESQALEKFFLSQSNIKAGINFHSYSQLLLRPSGYKQQRVPDEEILKSQGAKMVSDIHASQGETYTNQRAIDLYPAGGTLMDAYYENYKFNFGYVTELRDTGRYGFTLPEKFIKPTVLENYQAILDLCDAVVAL